MDIILYERLREQVERLEERYFVALRTTKKGVAYRELVRKRAALFAEHGITEAEFSDFALDQFDAALGTGSKTLGAGGS